MQLHWLKKYTLLTFDSIDSTNSEAIRLINSGIDVNYFLLLSKEQTQGRGQKGRDWISLNGNLHASIILPADEDCNRNPELSFIMANAMYNSIKTIITRHKLFLKIELKWPNDVLLNGKKIAGILLESINFKSKNYVVIGFGVNIIQAPCDLEASTTSLFEHNIELKQDHEFLDILINNFDKLYYQWKFDNNFERIREKWMKRAYQLNENITINDGVNNISGIFKGIDSRGFMKLELSNGKIIHVCSAEFVNNL